MKPELDRELCSFFLIYPILRNEKQSCELLFYYVIYEITY